MRYSRVMIVMNFLIKRNIPTLYEQIEEAYRFVLRHINRSAEINGLLRKERYELPVGAIREMIINAQCHLSFMDSSCVQVALFDDRLEITSPVCCMAD